MVSCGAALLIFLSLSGAFAEAAAQSGSAKDMQRQGEKIYRTGILSSGEPLQIEGNMQVPGTTYACVSCHLRSGFGSIEGGVYTTPTDGRTLFRSRDNSGSGNNRRNVASMDIGDKVFKDQPVIEPPPARPAYTDETLASVLRNGRDPAGRLLDPVMPRYNLNVQDMSSLVTYLKTLSVEYSPGVDKYSINFATVVTDEVPQEQVDAMMRPIESFVTNANKQQVQLEAQQVKLFEFPKDVTYRRVSHRRWTLKGNPDTWRGQLEEYYKKEPVFALIGGLTSRGWQPVHHFCEENAIPCILPSTDLPVVSESDQYTLYFSKGYYQEGEAAARYLQANNSSSKPTRIVQIVTSTPQGKALSAGFLHVMKNDSTYSITTIQRDAKEPLAQDLVQQVLDKEKPDVLVLWTEPGSLDNLKSIPKIASTGLMLVVSSSYLGSSLSTIPETLRDMTYITYPYRLPQDEKRYARFVDQKLSVEAQRVQGKTYSMLRILTQALREIKGDFYREYLFDLIGMRKDIDFTPYERLSFGTDQRYVSKGCYMVQLTKGSNPEFIKKSEWVIQ